MADDKRADKPAPPPSAPLADAGASIDPAVHHQLAVRQVSELRGDSEAVKAADAALAELGVTV